MRYRAADGTWQRSRYCDRILRGESVEAETDPQGLRRRPAHAHDQPEFRLLVAVWEEALFALRDPFPSGRQRDAEDWVRGKTRPGPFSFANACAWFDWEPETIRRGLARQYPWAFRAAQGNAHPG